MTSPAYSTASFTATTGQRFAADMRVSSPAGNFRPGQQPDPQHRGKITRALRLSFRMQRRQCAAGEWKLGHDIADGTEFADSPVNQAARQPSAQHVGKDGAVVASRSQRRPVRWQYFCFRAKQKRRSDLNGGRAKR